MNYPTTFETRLGSKLPFVNKLATDFPDTYFIYTKLPDVISVDDLAVEVEFYKEHFKDFQNVVHIVDDCKVSDFDRVEVTVSDYAIPITVRNFFFERGSHPIEGYDNVIVDDRNALYGTREYDVDGKRVLELFNYMYFRQNSEQEKAVFEDFLLRSTYKFLGKAYRSNLNSRLRKILSITPANLHETLSKNYKSTHEMLREEISELKIRLQEAIDKFYPIDYFLRTPATFLEKMKKELGAANKIKDVDVAYLNKEGDFIIVTNSIHIPFDEGRYGWNLGKIRIRVSRNGQAFITPLTIRGIKGFNNSEAGHPHVIERDGRLCLGDISTVVPELINKHEYAALTGIMMSFAKSVNLDDSAGKTVEKWPVIEIK